MEFVLIAVAILVLALITGISLLVGRGRRTARLDDDAAAGTTLTRPRAPEHPAPPRRRAGGPGSPRPRRPHSRGTSGTPPPPRRPPPSSCRRRCPSRG